MVGQVELVAKGFIRYHGEELQTYDVVADDKVIGEVGQQVETGLRYSCAVKGETREPLVRWFFRHSTKQWGDLDSQEEAIRDLLRAEAFALAAEARRTGQTTSH